MSAIQSYQAGRSAGGRYAGTTAGMDIAFKALLGRLETQASERSKTRMAAQESVMGYDPTYPFKILGLDVPPEVAALTASGASPSSGEYISGRTVKTGRGEVQYSPIGMTAKDLAKLYEEHIKNLDTSNISRVMLKQPIERLDSFPDWVAKRGYQVIDPASLSGKTTSTAQAATESSGRQQAIQFLQNNGAPVTEANIQAVIKKYKLNGKQ